jgi:acyl-coenzyme A synthetase/AMP-(fatty) acid ligase
MPENELQQLESSGDIQTIPDLLKFLNKNYANLVAITSKNFSKTYFDMLNDVAKMQSFLIAKEIKFGDIVGLHMKNEYAFITMFLAITSMGAISMVFPLSMPGILIANLIEKHHVRLLIYSDSLDKIYSS